MSNYNDELEKKRNESKKNLRLIDKNTNNKIENISNIENEVKENIYIENGCFYAIEEKFNYKLKEMELIHKRLTNFLISYKSRAIFEEQNLIKYIIEIEKDGIKFEKEMLSSYLCDSRTFKNFISRFLGGEFVFYGSDNNFNMLKEYLSYKEYNKNVGVDKLGFIKKENGSYLFIDSSNEIEGFQKNEDNSGLDARLFNNDCIDKDELKIISKHLFQWNNLENTIPTVLYPICCLLSKKFDDEGIKLFHLMISGEMGAGKSTGVENIILPMLGMDVKNINKAGGTDFTNLKLVSRSNTFPVIFEEYKPHKMTIKQKNFFSSVLRSAYDKQLDVRGRATQGLNKFLLTSPIIIVGEASIDESAIEDRSIQLHFRKIDHCEIGLNSTRTLKSNQKLLTKLGKTILEFILKFDNKKIVELYNKYLEKVINKNMNSRKKEHISKMLIAYDILENIFLDLGLDIYRETNVNKNILFDLLVESQEEIDTKSVIELTLELYDICYRTFMDEWDYKILDDGNIALDVKNTYHKILKYHKEHSLDQEILNYKEFTKQLRTCEYFVCYKGVKLRNAYESVADTQAKENSIKLKKCFILDSEKLKNKLDFDNIL